MLATQYKKVSEKNALRQGRLELKALCGPMASIFFYMAMHGEVSCRGWSNSIGLCQGFTHHLVAVIYNAPGASHIGVAMSSISAPTCFLLVTVKYKQNMLD